VSASGDTSENGRSRKCASAETPTGASRQSNRRRRRPNGPRPSTYAALDLGTNNCRLLVARPEGNGFRVIDAFSRIVRLGEGVSTRGTLSEAAMSRALAALQICAAKLKRNNVKRARLIATEACRRAGNGAEFLARVHEKTGLELEVVDRKTEAYLAVAGCAALLDPAADYALVFDIGGGSSEIMWVHVKDAAAPSGRASRGNGGSGRWPAHRIRAWTSLPLGVVTLAEKFGGINVNADDYEQMIRYVMPLLQSFDAKHTISHSMKNANVHLLGTSGTVTTIAGVHLGLKRYDRAQVDGCWLDCADGMNVGRRLLDMTHVQRIASPCIGRDRADLVLAGCAILEALMRQWPCPRLRVADRGLREGILTRLMTQDGAMGPRRKHRSRRRSGRNKTQRPCATASIKKPSAKPGFKPSAP
jgi:exopolyphosphatase/guanosine-5'-triphosphate,3'-diphosphate pyrophosphatase